VVLKNYLVVVFLKKNKLFKYLKNIKLFILLTK